MCSKHYERWRKLDTPEKNEFKRRWRNEDGSRKECLVPGCGDAVLAQGLCRTHYSSFHYESTRGATVSRKYVKRTNRDGSPINPYCEFPECGRPAMKAGLCSPHLTQKRKGRELRPIVEAAVCSVVWCESEYSTVRAKFPFCKLHVDARRRFNLTPDRLIEVTAPNVCQNPGCSNTENLFIDHDHSCCEVGRNSSTNQVSCGECVRGLLCATCNTALGMLQENPQRIRGLLGYLDAVKRRPHNSS